MLSKIITLSLLALTLLIPFAGNSQSFTSTWNTTNNGVSSSTEITIPTGAGVFNYDVDWDNDGIFDEFNINGPVTHDFGVEGVYTIRIQGDFPSIKFDNGGDKDKIIDISQWGDIEWESFENAFSGCSNLNSTAIDAPDLSNVGSLAFAFQLAEQFNGNLTNWDVSSVKNYRGMFWGASNFNQDLSNWNTSLAKDMAFMFFSATSFNGNLSTWNVEDVTLMSSMFSGATLFNGDVSNWNPLKVTDMSFMFSNASAFDQNIGAWTVASVTDMTDMLSNTAMSIENYDNTLIAWANQMVQDNVVIGANGLEYCGGENSRNTLININNWTFNGDSKNCPYFILQFDTSLPGSSNGSSVMIPTIGGNYDVDWDNDGIFDEFNLSGNVTHDFGNSGIYTIMIKGNFPRIYFNNSGDKDKLTSILQWGENPWTTMNGAFHGCSNLVINAGDEPDLSNVSDMSSMFEDASNFVGSLTFWDVSNVTDMSSMFKGATSFNATISGWDVSNVNSMEEMFRNASSFNQSLGGWNIEQVSTMTDMLSDCGMSTDSYDNTLIGWSIQNVQNNVALGANNLEYCAGESARSNLQDQDNWNISGDEKVCPFVTRWKTDNAGESNSTSITIPTFMGETYNYAVDWESDGIYDDFNIVGDITHDYGVAGVYQVSIKGDFPRIFFNNDGDKNKILQISEWGGIEWTSMNYAFRGCTNLDVVASDAPDLSNVTDLSGMFIATALTNPNFTSWDVSTVITLRHMFLFCDTFNGDLSTWDVSNVIDMRGMFSFAEQFNGNISTWNVSNVVDMSLMFDRAKKFNQPIGNWDVSSVVNMDRMFSGAFDFNQPLDNWDVSNVQNMNYMFHWTHAFNQSLNSWEVSNVTTMKSMFSTTMAFNGNIGNWDVSNVTDMTSMFDNSDAFNQDLNAWDVSSVTNMRMMFYQAEVFNGDIGNWDVSSVTSMYFMFAESPINQDLNSWDVSNVENFNSMFKDAVDFNGDISSWDITGTTLLDNVFDGATSFNSDISGWDVSNITHFGFLFFNANSFDQDLSSWDISNAEYMGWMFNNSGISTGNYDKILIAWSNLNVQPNVGLGAVGLTYCKGETARLVLILNKGWSFSGDSKDCSFTLTWKTDNPGSSPDDAIHIPTIGGGYNYDVDWNNDGTYDQFGINGSISYVFGQPGTYTIRIKGDFPRIYFNNSGDAEKLIDIIQWGDIEWTSMENAFFGCHNLNSSATDAPNLSNVTNMNAMFKAAIIFNGNVSEWDVSNVTNMEDLFAYAEGFEGDVSDWDVSNVTNMSNMFWINENFNSDISGWDVSNVTDMGGMFGGNNLFNADLSGWNVSNVTNMSQMFSGAESFDSDLSGWDVANVANMRGMFKDAEQFNSDISGWDVSNVSLMYHMFWGSDIFNIDISGWDVSNVTNMSSMFRGAILFNHDIGNWNVSNVNDISGMFSYTQNFNQDLSSWDLSNVDDMAFAFQYAEAFDQDLGSWNITSVIDMEEMLSESGLSENNYDQTLIGWANQNVMSNVVLGASGLNYCAGKSARDFLTGTKNWIITGDNNNCPPFITTWITSNPGSSPNDAISIPTTGTGYKYDVDWNNDGVFDQIGLTGSVSHVFPQPGTYTIQIRGDFPRIFFDGTGDSEKIVDVAQWGSIEWTSMENAFKGCQNLNVSATDAPDLSNVTNMSSMFYNARALDSDFNNWDVSNVTNMELTFFFTDIFNGDVSNWDVSNVQSFRSMFNNAKMFNRDISSWDVSGATDMILMFRDAEEFNQDIGNWDVSNVTTMSGMFMGVDSFNQYIGNWDVSNVTDFSTMFWYAKEFNQDISTWNMSNATDISSMFSLTLDFNQDISNWDVSNVDDMEAVFRYTSSFNQDISSWDVSNVTSMRKMFENAEVFDQNLGDWDVTSIVNMELMLTNSALSQENYDQTLIGWAGQAVSPNVTLDSDGLQYCVGSDARNTLINTHGWNISGDTKNCAPAFVTTWKTDNPGTSNATSITIPATGPGLMYHVDWENDGIYDDINVTGAITHDYGAEGTYTIAISGSLPRIAFNNGGDKDKILFINQWSDNEWSSMQNAFYGCSNLISTALDLPNLSNVVSTGSMFRGATSFNSGVSNWDMSNVSNTTFMFAETSNFNQNLSSWDVSNVENMSYMFYNATAFNGDVTNWNVGNVTNMYGLFWNASMFNQDLSSWNTSQVSDMSKMFDAATSFNQSLENWDISNVSIMNSMLSFSGLDIDNYDSTLIGWHGQNVQQNVVLGAEDLEYCASQFERDGLINSKGWNIQDDNLGCAPCGTITWMGGTDIWGIPGLWDLNRLPLPCDDVIIPMGSDVTLSSFNIVTIKSLFNEGIVRLESGSKMEIIDN